MSDTELFIAVIGILVVFTGLMLIAGVVFIFNRFFTPRESNPVPNLANLDTPVVSESGAVVPADHLVAIATAIECYRKIHFDILQTRITFQTGAPQTAWQLHMNNTQRVDLRK